MFRPDGEKKAYVRLAPDYDALDVANKVRLDFRKNALYLLCASDVNLFSLNASDAFKGTTDARYCMYIFFYCFFGHMSNGHPVVLYRSASSKLA